MLDVVLVGQFVWCAWRVGCLRLYDSLLFAGGWVAAGYTAWTASDWMGRWFLPTRSVMSWLQTHLTTDAVAVNALSWMVPPQPVTVGNGSSAWIAVHVARTFLFIALTGAVFASFVVVVQLRRALWDDSERPLPKGAQALRWPLATLVSLCMLVQSMLLFSDLAWLRGLHGLVPLVQSSWLIHILAVVSHGLGR